MFLSRNREKRIVDLFNNTVNNVFKGPLKVELPIETWHTLNHSIMNIKHKRIRRYNPRLNLSNLKGIVAFLITLYEFDSFSKVLVAVGVPEHNELTQSCVYATVSQYYILRWLPGMLTSRYIMARDFVRSTPAKSPVVRYNLKYMKTTVYRLFQIPDLLILNTMNDMGAIVAKEAVIMKLPAIGLASSRSFPDKIAFKFFGDVTDLRFIRSFLAVIGLSMRVGRELSLYNNFTVEEGDDFRNRMYNAEATVDLTGEPVLSIDKIKYEYQFGEKSFVLSATFEHCKIASYFFRNIRLSVFRKFYNNFDFVSKYANLTRSKDIFNYKLNKITLDTVTKKRKIDSWFKPRKTRVQAAAKAWEIERKLILNETIEELTDKDVLSDKYSKILIS